MSCASDHIDHVKTQAPYAVVCGLAAILIGYLPAGFGISPLFTLPLGCLALWALVRFYGQRSAAKEEVQMADSSSDGPSE